ncbi:MAG: 2,4-didehydro-3-deoxy-L-rhamnonate hydrolase [Actinomycetota bacterium]|nr:2,4-didehydro-3-deoxy-L-rhamnonate hydrolase [Actinomycetota bacterium]
MNLARLGPRGAETPVVVTDDATLELSGPITDLDEDCFARGSVEQARLARSGGEPPELRELPASRILRVGPPLARPSAVELEIEELRRQRHEMVGGPR